jgi:hypothetical protein
MALTRRKKIVFALITITISFVGMLVVLLAADLVLHQRAERSAGLNRYGYRGPVVGGKQPRELRVVMLGGSTVFGYGVAWNESIPVSLEARLKERLNRPVRVVNLGFNNEGAYAFVPNLEDFEYLDYDVIVLYEGYNDLPGDQGVNRSVYRRDSAVYRLVGYYPILPLYLDEKAKMLRFGNDLNAAYVDSRRNPGDPSTVVFKPGLAKRTSAAALDAVASMTKALDGQLANTGITPPPATKESESQLGCTFPYVTYCESVAAGVRFGLSHGKAVVVGSQPRSRGELAHALHTKQQEMLAAMIARVFANEPRVVWADFSQLIDLTNVDLTFDGMHLSPGANATVAAALVEPVIKASSSGTSR